MATLDGDGGGKYPEATSTAEPNNKKPINNLQGPVPKVLEPISTDDLDKLHSLKSDSNACIDDWANNNMFESMLEFESNSERIYAEYSNIDTFLDDVDLFSIYPELESSSKPADIAPEDDIDFSEYFDFDKYYGVEESSSKPSENPNTSSEHSSSVAHPSNSDFSPAPTILNGFPTSSISPTESGTTPTISSKPCENSSSSDSSASEPGSSGPATHSKATTADRTANDINSYTGFHNEQTHFDRVVGGSKPPGDGALADGEDVRRAFWQNVINGHHADGSGPSSCGPPQNDSAMHNGPMNGSTAQNGPDIQNGPKPPHVPKMQHGISMPMHVPKMQNGVLTYNRVPMPRDFSLGSLVDTDAMPTSFSPLSTGLVPWDIFLMQDDTMSQDSASIQNFPLSEDGSLMVADPMPPFTRQMQNSAVPPNSSLLQNNEMSQYVLPSQNSPVLQHGRPIQNGSVSSFGPSTHNGPVSRYGRPIRNGSAPQYEFPTQNGSMPSYGPSMHNGSTPQYGFPTQNDSVASYGPSMRTASASEYWFSESDSIPSYGTPMHNAPMPLVQNGMMLPDSAPMHNGTMSAYDPQMQNPRVSTNGGYFEPTDRQASARQGTIVRSPSGRILRSQGLSGYASHGSNSNTQGRNLQFPNAYVNDRQVADEYVSKNQTLK